MAVRRPEAVMACASKLAVATDWALRGPATARLEAVNAPVTTVVAPESVVEPATLRVDAAASGPVTLAAPMVIVPATVALEAARPVVVMLWACSPAEIVAAVATSWEVAVTLAAFILLVVMGPDTARGPDTVALPATARLEPRVTAPVALTGPVMSRGPAMVGAVRVPEKAAFSAYTSLATLMLDMNWAEPETVTLDRSAVMIDALEETTCEVDTELTESAPTARDCRVAVPVTFRSPVVRLDAVVCPRLVAAWTVSPASNVAGP